MFFKAIGLNIVSSIKDFKRQKKNTIKCVLKCCNFVANVVRHHQPQQDVDTIRAMSNKYGSSGGELYHDNCFNFETDIVNDEGKPDTDSVRVDFSLDDNHGFARAYYRDELIKANCDPDFQVRWYDDSKRNPKYYEEEAISVIHG